MEAHIQKALDAATKQNIKGKEVTPFLLQYLAEHTHGESLQSNIALILNNAKAGAAIAVAYASL
jgi:pseudouridylate synthase